MQVGFWEYTIPDWITVQHETDAHFQGLRKTLQGKGAWEDG